jgi:hypothetical protein
VLRSPYKSVSQVTWWEIEEQILSQVRQMLSTSPRHTTSLLSGGEQLTELAVEFQYQGNSEREASNERAAS